MSAKRGRPSSPTGKGLMHGRQNEPQHIRTGRLKARWCRKGHPRSGRNGIVAVDYRTGGLRVICRTCLNIRQRLYYAEGRPYRYLNLEG